MVGSNLTDYQRKLIDNLIEKDSISIAVEIKSDYSVLICENCKKFWVSPTTKCVCGSTSLTKTHKSNIKYADEIHFLESLIGRNKILGQLMCDEFGFPWRLTRENDIFLVVTDDINPDRINIVVENEIITEATFG